MALLTEDRTLYVFHKNTLTTVSEDVQSFKLSTEGKGIAYLNEENELILYNVSNESTKTITDELFTEALAASAYHLSPDGASIAYAEGTLEDYALFVYSNDKRTEIEEKSLPLGLSNKAEFVYFANAENTSVYVQNKDDEQVKLVNGNLVVTMLFNADHTQVLINSGTDCYASIEGEEKHKISSKSLAKIGSYEPYAIGVSANDTLSFTTPILSFEEEYFLDQSGALYYIDKKLETNKIAGDVESFQTTAAGDVVYYLNSYGELYRGKDYDDEFDLMADDVDEYVITSDGKACYYIDYDDTLRYLKKAKKSEKIAEDVRNLIMTRDDYALFISDYSYTSGGTLYESHNGKERERVAGDVTSITVTSATTYYYRASDEGDSYDLYGATKKVKFEKIAEEIHN